MLCSLSKSFLQNKDPIDFVSVEINKAFQRGSLVVRASLIYKTKTPLILGLLTLNKAFQVRVFDL